MYMSFWNGYILEDFIFKDFDTKSVGGFMGLFVALVSIGILSEGLNLLKKELMRKYFTMRRLAIQTQTSSEAHSHPQDQITIPRNGDREDMSVASEDVEDFNVNSHHSLINDQSFNEIRANFRISQLTTYRQTTLHPQLFYLLTSSMLHGCYAFLGYTVMNAVMTFNTFVLFSVCLGMGLGYFVFRAGTFTITNVRNDDDYMQRNAPQTHLTENNKTDSANDNNDEEDDDEDNDHVLARASPISECEHSIKDIPAVDEDETRPIPSRNGNEKIMKYCENGNENESQAAQVIVVGAQVHCDYQQSV